MARLEVKDSRIPVFVYAKEPRHYVITCNIQGCPDYMSMRVASLFRVCIRAPLCNYVGFFDSRIQDVREPHTTRRFGRVCSIIPVVIPSEKYYLIQLFYNQISSQS